MGGMRHSGFHRKGIATSSPSPSRTVSPCDGLRGQREGGGGHAPPAGGGDHDAEGDPAAGCPGVLPAPGGVLVSRGPLVRVGMPRPLLLEWSVLFDNISHTQPSHLYKFFYQTAFAQLAGPFFWLLFSTSFPVHHQGAERPPTTLGDDVMCDPHDLNDPHDSHSHDPHDLHSQQRPAAMRPMRRSWSGWRRTRKTGRASWRR